MERARFRFQSMSVQLDVCIWLADRPRRHLRQERRSVIDGGTLKHEQSD